MSLKLDAGAELYKAKMVVLTWADFMDTMAVSKGQQTVQGPFIVCAENSLGSFSIP